MELAESLRLLAEQNFSGSAFLVAYGVTWLICGVLWRRLTERTAAYVTLFQGLFAFPVALGLSALVGAIGQERPVTDTITQLSVLIGTSQLLGLPFLIHLVVRHRYTVVPVAFAAITAMHFVLYAWLYQTPVYVVMAGATALGTTIVTLATPEDRQRAASSRVCLLTGALLLATAAFFLVSHLVLTP